MTVSPNVTDIQTIGFVGLGDQGTPMAMRLLEVGWPLTVYARRPEVAKRFESLGADVAASLRELGAHADMICVCVMDDEQVRAVLHGPTGDDGLLSGMRRGSVLVIHSTVHPDTCTGIADQAALTGVEVADAPVSGGRARSYAGELTIMVGCTPTVYERIAPILAACGSLVRRMGNVGSGQVVKLVNNYFTCAQMALAADEAALIRALGLQFKDTVEVLATCSGSSTWFAMEAARQFKPPTHDKSVTYALQEVLAKDVRLARDIIAAAGAAVPITETVVAKSLEHIMGMSTAQ